MGVTEGVSFVGCSGPMVYTPAIIGSEIFEWLRSSKYTPSVSHSLDSSLREGAGDGCTIQPGARKPWGFGRFSSPLRKGGFHSSHRSETPTLRAIFIAPTEGAFHSSQCSGKSGVGADAPTPLGVSGRDEITLGYLAQASIWLWISAMMSSRPESRMVASMVATVCSGSWVPVIRMGRYSL